MNNKTVGNFNNQRYLLRAMEFVNWAHRDQKRKTSQAPYIIHPFHGIILLMECGLDPKSDQDLEILAAFALHDSIEDNPEEVTYDLIMSKFGTEVARIVRTVTLDPKNPDKRLSRQKILLDDWKVQIVKVADILSNTIAISLSVQRVGLVETQKHFKQPIADRIAMEQEFLGRIKISGVPMTLIKMTWSTLAALGELKEVASNPLA
jgi:(p)ppGpp synthase/HD superfamily hydrolase